MSRVISILILFIAVPIAYGSGGAVDHNSGNIHRLRLYHTHTNERIDVVYRQGDHYRPEAIAELDNFLRDHRTGEVRHFDPRLFDLLSDITASVGRPDEEINVICGYRTPWSNAFLRHRSSAAPENSLPPPAIAIGIRLPSA